MPDDSGRVHDSSQNSTSAPFNGNFAVVLSSPSKKKYNTWNYTQYAPNGKQIPPREKAIRVERDASPLFFMEGDDEDDDDGEQVDEEIERTLRHLRTKDQTTSTNVTTNKSSIAQQPVKRGRGRPRKISRQTSMTEFAGPTRLNRGKEIPSIDLISEEEGGDQKATANSGKENGISGTKKELFSKRPETISSSKSTTSTTVSKTKSAATYESMRLAAKGMRSKKQANVRDMFSSPAAQKASSVPTKVSEDHDVPTKKRKLSDYQTKDQPISNGKALVIDDDDDSDDEPIVTSERKSSTTLPQRPTSPLRKKLVKGSEISSTSKGDRSIGSDGTYKSTSGHERKGKEQKNESSSLQTTKKRSDHDSFSSRKKAMEELRSRVKKKSTAPKTNKALYDTDSDDSDSSVEEEVEEYDPKEMKNRYLNGDDREFVVSDEEMIVDDEDDDNDDGKAGAYSANDLIYDKHRAHKLTNYEHQPSIVNFSTMKDEDKFRYVFHWILFLLLDETFDPTTEYFMGPIRHLDRKLDTLRHSSLESAGWTSEFRSGGLCRPHIHVKSLNEDGPEHDYGCAACGRKNHRASSEITFTGRPYRDRDLQPVKKENRDSRGLAISPENVPFQVGRFCKEKAVFAHQLRHWRWNLKEDVEKTLKEQGLMEPEIRAIRANMKKPERTKYVNNVLTSLEEMGTFQTFYLKFRKTLVKVERWIADRK